MENIEGKTVGEIVSDDYRAAKVFEEHKIDFCCHGGKNFKEVAAEKNLDMDAIVEELKKATEGSTESKMDFDSWPLDLLADYIVKTHHKYAEKQIQVLRPYLEKLCQVHGDRHPELFEIRDTFLTASGHIAAHQKKEEIMLFPFIKKMAKAQEEGGNVPRPMRPIDGLVDMLTEEHDGQGAAFHKIADLSNHYTTPADGCNTYRATLGFLKEFEENLHQHIHLENNILFPKALKMTQEMF